jgi:hypothetical protein
MKIRMVAYRMNISPDAAEALADEVGEELAGQLLERVRKMSDRQKSFPFHPRKKSNATIFAQEADICRRRFQGERRARREAAAHRESVAKSRRAYEKGVRPDIDTLYEQLEDGVDTIDLDGNRVTYEELKGAIRFLEYLEEDE